MALRISVMLGMHRKAVPDHMLSNEETIAQEQRKRLFWSVYCLEQ
jgi:hypothetical protein